MKHPVYVQTWLAARAAADWFASDFSRATLTSRSPHVLPRTPETLTVELAIDGPFPGDGLGARCRGCVETTSVHYARVFIVFFFDPAGLLYLSNKWVRPRAQT